MPSTKTAVSNSNATIPVARLAYQNAVLPLMSAIPVSSWFWFVL
jgi:hypothetical protein